MNKYEKWYKEITLRGQTRVLETYTETHHIIPRSLGGSNDNENITNLTAREHFICHWLLLKIYKDGEEHWKMLNALRIMRAENKNQDRYSTKITSRVYQQLKEEYSKLQSIKFRGENNGFFGKKHTEKTKQKISQANTGEKNGAKKESVRIKIAESKKGVKRQEFSEEWRQNLSKAASGENNGMFGKTHSDDAKQKQREKALGRKQSEETKKKKADAIRGIKREKKLCPHCQQEIAVNTYARWHGEKCKEA